MRRWARVGHGVIGWMLLLGILVQFYAAGLMIYGAPLLHQLLGYVILLVAVVWTILGAVAAGWGTETKTGLALVVVLVLQPIFVFVLATQSRYLGALHPVNGLVAFTIVVAFIARERANV